MPASLAEQLFYAHRRYLDGECKICHARPAADGERVHGKGCYDLSEDGGGSDYPEADVDWGTLPEYERAAWEAVALEACRSISSDLAVIADGYPEHGPEQEIVKVRDAVKDVTKWSALLETYRDPGVGT